MGFQERRDLAEQFKQKTKQAVDEAKQPLLSGIIPVETNLLFECIKSPPEANIVVGDTVRVINMLDKIEVFKNMVGVGHVVAADSFRDSLNLTTENGLAVSATVVEVSELSPTFVIKVYRN